MGRSPGVDGNAAKALLDIGRFFTRWDESDDGRAVFRDGGRAGDVFYRDRWSHDKVVRSTHGVNCTGSCSWKVYVKDGIITWETQETDYPSVGADRPEYEPRGCPRGAAFSWYTYSPTRVRHPYARGVLVEMYRAAKARVGDPVLAWADVVGDPVRRRAYQQARGKGGLVRVTWDEAIEIAAAAHVHTIKTYGPDRCAGFSPIPAMSMVSHCVGTRFIQLIGGVMTSFYDWYADLPVASPQVFGDQTDVPESGDWWDATYLMMWGSNIPVTRTPDAHWMAEVRYRGTKIVTVSPDYADNTKFADEWLPAAAGTDAALAMAMGHVILTEFFVRGRTDFFDDYVRRFTDLPFLIHLDEHEDGWVPGKFVTADELAAVDASAPEDVWKTVVLDEQTAQPVVPNGSMGFRYADSGVGRWNLDLEGVTPALSVDGEQAEPVVVYFPAFDAPDGSGSVLRRGVPARRVGGHLVTTVYDLMLAQYGVARDGLPGDWPSGYDDVTTAYTPAWQAEITGVPADAAIRIAREFASNAEESGGRSMIIMGAGICQWFHGDATYRAILTLLILTGCMGRNGGGWAHYVGQEKCRPITGWISLANALDWTRPPRTMTGTSYWYMHTDQWRNDGYSSASLASPLSRGVLDHEHTADAIAQSARLGWMPFYPQFSVNPLDVAEQARAAIDSGAATDAASYVTQRLSDGTLTPAITDVDAPENWPRTLVLWRSNLMGSSAKGNEYFLRHLLGTHHNVLGTEKPDTPRPREVVWHEQAPEGKLDFLMSADFRMTSTTLLSDVVFPAATWYEKHDLSSTDMHPFVHAFSPAIDPHTLASVLPAVGAALDIWTPTKLALPPARDVVLLLVDGLGSLLLDEHAASAPHLAALPNTTLRAGFPATTATSITSLTSGTACGVHGIVGYSFRPEDDARTRGSRRVLNALRWSLDQADGPSALVTYPPSLISPHEGILDGLDDAGVRITYVMPGEFRGTGLTQVAFGAPGRHLPAVTPDGIRSAITSVLARRSRQRRLIYAYYSDLDTAGHLHGPGSDQWLAKLRIVDRLVADLVGGLPPDTTLLVTGDHGMIIARAPVDIDTTPILLDGTDAVAGEARVLSLIHI